MTSTWSHIENELSVAGKSVADAPSAFLHELQDDWSNHKGSLLIKNLEAAGLGIATAIAYKAAPMTTLIGTGLLIGYEGIKNITPAIGAAWNANTEDQRNQLGIKYGGALGSMSANIVETLPGFMLGSRYGQHLIETNPTVRKLAFKGLTKPFEYPLQRFKAFHGAGVDMLPAEATAGGKIDALKMSDVVQPAADKEVARSIELGSGKVSKVFTGTDVTVKPQFPDRSGNLFVHTHLPDVGPRPSLLDLRTAADFGIIRSGDYRSFFLGQGAVEQGAERLQALVLDNAHREAFLIDQARDTAGSKFLWKTTNPLYVDYDAARTTLQSLDLKTAWSQFKGLPTLDTRIAIEHANIVDGLTLKHGM